MTQKLSDDPPHKNLRRFLDVLDTAQFYPAGKSSWPKVAQAVEAKIGGTVVDGGEPSAVLGDLQRTARTAAEKAGS